MNLMWGGGGGGGGGDSSIMKYTDLCICGGNMVNVFFSP